MKIIDNGGLPSLGTHTHSLSCQSPGNLPEFGEDFSYFDNGSPLQLDQDPTPPLFRTNRPFTLYNYGTAQSSRQSKRPSSANRADFLQGNMAKDPPPPRPPSGRTNKGQITRFTGDNDENDANLGKKKAAKPPETREPPRNKEEELKVAAENDSNLKKKELLPLVATLRESLYVQSQKLKSSEMNKEALMNSYTRLRTKFKELQDSYKELDDRNKELEETPQDDSEILGKLRKTEKALADAIANYDKLKATSSGKIKKLERKLENALMSTSSKSDKVNEQFLKVLAEKVKTIGWGKIKFIQNHQEQIIAAKIMWKHGELEKTFAENREITKELKMDFIKTYSDYIRGYIFEKRSYATAEVKKWYMSQWKKKKPTLTLEDLQKCLARKIVTEEEMDKFMIYWDEIIAKHIGSSKWKDGTKYYHTISGAIRNDCETTLPLITPYDEAFLVVSTENHLQRWEDEFNNVQPAKKQQPEATDNAQPTDEKDGKLDKKTHSGLYTSTTSGQNQYGGWNEKGLEIFNQYVKTNEEARKQDFCLQVEKRCLQMLRDREKIEANNPEDHNKAKSRQKSAKKRGNENAPMPPTKKIIRTLQDVESSDEEKDEDEDE
jgi:hypothetical protein